MIHDSCFMIHDSRFMIHDSCAVQGLDSRHRVAPTDEVTRDEDDGRGLPGGESLSHRPDARELGSWAAGEYWGRASGLVSGGPRVVAGGWWLVAGGWWMVAGGWWMVAGDRWLRLGSAGSVPCALGLSLET